MSISSPIIPAIIPQSYEDLILQIEKITGLPEVHVDVVDGVFAPSLSWPYHDKSRVEKAYELLAPFSLEVDLMVESPLVAARDWLKAGADQFVFHIEGIDVNSLSEFTAECSVTVGVAIGSATPLETLYPYLPFVDYVQLMGIAIIGSQGQPFDETVLERIKKLSNKFPELPLSIDGSVNENTLPLLKKLNLSRFIVGSRIMGQVNPIEAYQKLNTLVSS